MLRLKNVFYLSLVTVLIGCGSGGSDPANQTGGVTILIGDGPLENVDQVNIDIGRMLLIGADGQIVLTENATEDPINLLDLRNVTELLMDVGDIPVGSYSKIRMYIDSLEIVEDETVPDSGVVLAQLPANGKIDLNPQGEFEISAGENLVIQIDVDLDRSVHTVFTGNSQYRFRPVVFIDVLDQRANLRLTRLFGTAARVTDVDPDTFDLCPDPVSTTDDHCRNVEIRSDALRLTRLEDDLPLADDDEVHAFGHFVVGALAPDGVFFRALAVVQGAEDTVAKIDGEVAASPEDDSIASIGGTAVAPITEPPPGALLLDGLGNPITGAENGQHAESWAQVDPVLELPDAFPSFLTQVGSALDEESVTGMLFGADTDSITILTDDLDEVCVLFDNDLEIQQVDSFGIDASTGLISPQDLIELGLDLDVEAFGTFEEGVDPACLIASVIVVETN